jgi:hypothetical protein
LSARVVGRLEIRDQLGTPAIDVMLRLLDVVLRLLDLALEIDVLALEVRIAVEQQETRAKIGILRRRV